MKGRIFTLIVLSILYMHNSYSQQLSTIKGIVKNEKGEPLQDVLLYLNQKKLLTTTDEKGRFEFKLPANSTYEILLQSINISPVVKTLVVQGNTYFEVEVEEIVTSLKEVVIGSETDAFGIRQLRSLEAGGLYEGKKTEVINIEKLISNKATNNARQAFSKVPSLNIWESDNGGLQLDIGGRGLSPRRTSSFNTRQNGYDISADALGYPESYYTPPLQAVKQVEVVRGAGALQYGSQFGGLVNFKLKKGDSSRPVNFESHNTYGAYQLFNTFNSLHGQIGKLNHYSYVFYKRGNGWRPNSAFDQFGAYTSLNYDVSSKLKLGLDFTHMYYLSQQAGGLTDEQFREDPQQSTRSRNWFRVNWTLPAFNLEYDISANTKLYSRTFGLIARRGSLGILTTPDEPDVAQSDEFQNRDLIDGKFRNIGNETRLTINYDTKKGLKNSILIGTRFYRGFTNFSQQLGSTGADADFKIVDTAIVDRRKSDFDFPNFNGAVFVEKILRLNETLSLIPGIRYEYIFTSSDGILTTPVRVSAFGDVVEQDSINSSERQRHVFLYGLGLSKRFNEKYELYSNATANYRAINFTDIQIQTNTQLVDPSINDENGFSFDLGLRKLNFKPFFFEAGLFFIQYNDRIGEVLDDGLRVRTNIGSGRIVGLEVFFESDIFALLKKETDQQLSIFFNGSINRGVYTQINDRITADGIRSGNRLEDIPQYNIKSGVSYRYKNFSASLQTTFVGEQFSDAANTRVNISSLVETTGVFGEIPAYFVMDFSARYQFNDVLSVSTSVNNLLNEAYFTRRATAYPGPGIIPALGRIWNATLSLKL
ncbi:MAG: TonB-dependent receptor [Bacteroidota bacterium]